MSNVGPGANSVVVPQGKGGLIVCTHYSANNNNMDPPNGNDMCNAPNPTPNCMVSIFVKLLYLVNMEDI